MCLIQNWISASSWLVSFEKKTKPKQNHRRQKTPSQHNFLPSDEKVTMVTGEKDQMLPFWGRAAHISSKSACSGGEGCQETLHSKSISGQSCRSRRALEQCPRAGSSWQTPSESSSPAHPQFQLTLWFGIPRPVTATMLDLGRSIGFVFARVCLRVRLAPSPCHELTRCLVLLIHILWPGYCVLIGWAAAQALEQVAW